jgi:hypothetical protein
MREAKIGELGAAWAANAITTAYQRQREVRILQFGSAEWPMIRTQASQRNFAAASDVVLAESDSYKKLFMSPIAIGTAIGAAALTVGRGAVSAVGEGASFAAQLVTPADPRAADQKKQSQTSAAQAAFKQRADELSQRIERQLAAAGIQLSKPVELVSDGQGGISVATDDPNAAAIQSVLSSDILLERDFTMLAGDYEEFVQSTITTDMPSTLNIVIPKAS